MQAKYDKAIAVGMAGVLLLFISIYLSSSIVGIGMSYGDELAWAFAIVISIFCALLIIGFVSACIAGADIASRRDVIEVSSVAGAVPLSLVLLVFAYLALHAGPSAFIPYFIAGLAILLSGLAASVAGGMLGHIIMQAMAKRRAVK